MHITELPIQKRNGKSIQKMVQKQGETDRVYVGNLFVEISGYVTYVLAFDRKSEKLVFIPVKKNDNVKWTKKEILAERMGKFLKNKIEVIA